MAHVTFIHGISNKPPKEDLLRIWRDALAEGDCALPLGDYGVTSDMVYWADVLYESPDLDISAYESLEGLTAESVDAGGGPDFPDAATDEERQFLTALRSRFTSLNDLEIESLPATTLVQPEGIGLERVPLPWPLKKLILRAFLRDVHHYLFDTVHSPRPGVSYQVRKEIRRRFVEGLKSPTVTSPHIVVAHSLGTVIAYDCLKNLLNDCPRVDGFITLGSPLGIDEVQDRLTPGWTRNDGYPYQKDAGGWTNVCDPLDPVCGFDAEIANEFLVGGTEKIQDQMVVNGGNWRHSAVKYLRRPDVRCQLRAMLNLPC